MKFSSWGSLGYLIGRHIARRFNGEKYVPYDYHDAIAAGIFAKNELLDEDGDIRRSILNKLSPSQVEELKAALREEIINEEYQKKKKGWF